MSTTPTFSTSTCSTTTLPLVLQGNGITAMGSWAQTTISTGSYTTYGWKSKNMISVEEFMKIEDVDKQKYLFVNHCINLTDELKTIDNDEKYGIYVVDKRIRLNNQGIFYCNNKLREWLVYNKLTKKVKISNSNTSVFNSLLKDSFCNLDIIKKFITKPTPTLCKKIIEGNIKKISDIVSYHRSYTLRKKSLSLELIYKFIIYDVQEFLHIIDDPENVNNFEELLKLRIDIPELLVVKPFRFKVIDIPLLKKRYDEWVIEQGKKYDIFQ